MQKNQYMYVVTSTSLRPHLSYCRLVTLAEALRASRYTFPKGWRKLAT